MSIKRLKDKELKHITAGAMPLFAMMLLHEEGADRGAYAKKNHPGGAVAIS